MKRRLLLPFVLLTLLLLPRWAEANCGPSSMGRAREAYEIGKFNEAIRLLQECLNAEGFNKQQKEAAFRIMAVSYIEIDSIDQAIHFANELITLNPSFPTRPEDPLRFQQLIADIRQGQLNRLISSVSKTNENSAEAPATVIVITAEEIAQRGYQTLMEVLADLPGFDITVTRGVTYGMVYQRGYRSILTDRTLFLIDGVEENDLSSNHAFISRQYPLSNIKRVEVVYGPTSTMYGANAFVGVINVVTKEGTEMIKQGNSVGFNGSVSYGGLNTKIIDATVAARHKSVSFITSARVFRSDEMDLSKYDNWNYELDSDELYISRLSTNNASRIATLNSRYKSDSGVYYIIDKGVAIPTAKGIERARMLDNKALDTILHGNPISARNETQSWGIYSKLRISDFTLCYQTWFRREGNIGWYNTRHAGSDNGGVWQPKNSFIYLRYEKNLSDNLSLTIFTRYKAHELSDETAFVTLQSYRNGGSDILRLMQNYQPVWSSRYFFRISKQLRNEIRMVYGTKRFNTVVGGEFRNSFIQGDYIGSVNEPIPSQNGFPDTANVGNYFNQRDIGFYLQSAYYATTDLKLVLGGRFDNNHVRYNLGYGTVFNPRLAVVYSPGQFIFKAMYAQAFKEPSNFTRYSSTADRVPAPNLKNETVQNFELSAHWETKDQKLSAELVGYYASYEGIVGTGKDEKTGKSQFKNLGTSVISGIQATAYYMHKNYTFFANYSYTNPLTTEATEQAAQEKEQIRISDIASHRFNVGANALFMKTLNVNLRANYVGKRLVGEGTSTGNTNKLLTQIDPYLVFNGSVSYSPKMVPGMRIQLTLSNLLDAVYEHPGIREADNVTYVPTYPQPGRLLTATVGYTF